MARAAVVARQARRLKMVMRYKKKRDALRAQSKSIHATYEERIAAVAKISAMPRDASPVRLRNRCPLSSRANGFYRRFGLARQKLREVAMRGDVPGLTKASW